MKKNIVYEDNILDKLLRFNAFSFNDDYSILNKEHLESQDKRWGFSAQEVQKTFPELVRPAPIDENYLTLDYVGMIPLLHKGISNLHDEIKRLNDKIVLLEEKINGYTK